MYACSEERKQEERKERKKKEAAYIQTMKLPCCLGLPYQHDSLAQIYALVGPPRCHDTRRLSRTPLDSPRLVYRRPRRGVGRGVGCYGAAELQSLHISCEGVWNSGIETDGRKRSYL